MRPGAVYGRGVEMAEPGGSATGPEMAAPAPPDHSRNLAFRIALAGLILLVLGFTGTLVANAFYPCEPAAGSIVQPPLADCAVSLSPWIGIALAGLLVAVAGYLRVG